MPEKRTVERARKKARAGKAPSTQAGEFVRERETGGGPPTQSWQRRT